MDDQKLNQLISDELLRERIRKIGQATQKSFLEKASNNDLVKLLFGFFLTGIVGFILTSHYQQEQSLQQARVAGVNSFSDALYSRYTRAFMLASAIRRGASDDELKKRKEQYDDAYVAWGSTLRRNMFVLRQAQDTVQYSKFESVVQYKLVPLYNEIDKCLTAAYDSRFSRRLPNDSVNHSLDQCLGKDPTEPNKLSAYFQAALDCSSATTGVFYKRVMGGPSVRLTGDDDIDARCSIKGPP
jgi:hypothetical protein